MKQKGLITMSKSPGGYNGYILAAILAKESSCSRTTSGSKFRYPYSQTPCSCHCSEEAYMSQRSDHFLLNSQRSLKHEFCVVVVCVLCACHDPIEATVPQPCNFTPVPPARLSSLGYFAPWFGTGLRTRLHFGPPPITWPIVI